MEHADFKIGSWFRTGSGLWRCTDVGTRTIAAIHIETADAEDGSGQHWTVDREQAEKHGHFNGPPYSVVEHVFDENDFGGCNPDEEEMLSEVSDQPEEGAWRMSGSEMSLGTR